MLAPVVQPAVSGAEVWIARPDVARATPGANIYLYRSTVSPVQDPAELPARPNGTPAGSHIVLGLHYLLTFHGDDDQLEPQRLLGAVSVSLDARPLIPPSLLAEVRAAARGAERRHSFLTAADLGEADEQVRLASEPLTLEGLTRLWSLFPRTPYQLSSAYVARAVTLNEP